MAEVCTLRVLAIRYCKVTVNKTRNPSVDEIGERYSQILIIALITPSL